MSTNSTVSQVPYASDVSWSTGGYDVGDQTSFTNLGYSTLYSAGPASLQTSVPVPYAATPAGTQNNYSNNSIVQTLQTGNTGATSSTVVVPTAGGFLAGSSGSSTKPTAAAHPNPVLPVIPPKSLYTQVSNTGVTYTGSDLTLIIEIANTGPQALYTKQLIECTTISISTHREKAPVRALGYINPKGFTRGTRTIAGTMVLTQFTVEVLAEFLQNNAISINDLSKDSTYLKVDQLPPFNITMVFGNEAGYASYRRLLGVQFVTDGIVYSIQDMLSEQTISFMCEDFTPLIKVDTSSLFHLPQLGNPATSTQATPMSKIASTQNTTGNSSTTNFVNIPKVHLSGGLG